MSKAATYWQRGEAIDYKNTGTATIEAGTCVIVGSVLGVAGTDIPAGEVGSLHVTGVFEIPKKASVALTAGQKVTFTDANGIDAAGSGATVFGYAVEAAAAADATALVKLLG